MEEYEVLVEGKFVAGMRSPGKGKTLKLTPLQAVHPMRKGEIRIAQKKVAPKKGAAK